MPNYTDTKRRQENADIRDYVEDLVKTKGSIKSRDAITDAAGAFDVTRQRVSGNISTLARNGRVIVNRNYPNSTLS